MSKQKKTLQLGMNPSTASGRLVKDLLFHHIQKEGYTCYRCGGELTRDTFSIEHKEPWLDSDNPVEMYFSIENISYSHLSCNVSASRTPNKKYESEEARKRAAADRSRDRWNKLPKDVQKDIRRKKYERNGK